MTPQEHEVRQFLASLRERLLAAVRDGKQVLTAEQSEPGRYVATATVLSEAPSEPGEKQEPV